MAVEQQRLLIALREYLQQSVSYHRGVQKVQLAAPKSTTGVGGVHWKRFCWIGCAEDVGRGGIRWKRLPKWIVMPPSVHPMLPFHLAHATGALIGLLQCLFKHYAGLEYSWSTDARYMMEFGAAGTCVCVCRCVSVTFPALPTSRISYPATCIMSDQSFGDFL